MQGFEILERARDARAPLLTVERLPRSDGDERLGDAFLLVFDAGRVLVTPDAEALCIRHIEQAEDLPVGLHSSVEEEPWWRVIGCALSGVWSEADGQTVRLELATEAAVPRSITLSFAAGAVRSALAPAHD